MKRIPLKPADFKIYLPVVVIALLSAANYSVRVLRTWATAKGWEYEWIGRAIADGKGFSFPGDHRWLFQDVNPEHYFPTAWSDPIYPFFLGANFFLFGEYGKLVILLSNVLFYFLTCIILFWTVKKLSSNAIAYIAAIIFVLLPSPKWVVTGYLGNSALVGLLILISSVLAIWYIKENTWKKSIPMGLYLGFMALTHAGTLLFAPAMSLYLIIIGKNKPGAIKSGAVLCLFTFLAISPWTLRNYIVFNDFIPVRNGVGQILYVTNTALGHTLQTSPEKSATVDVPVPWTSDGLWDSWKNLMDNKKRRVLEAYAEQKIAAEVGETYQSSNETERDKFLQSAAKQYILQNPIKSIILSSIKAVHFFIVNWPQYIWKIPAGPILTLLGIAGALLLIRKREVTVVTVLILSYATPYMATGPYFYRYRYPIESLIVILSSLMIATIIDKLNPRNKLRAADSPSATA